MLSLLKTYIRSHNTLRYYIEDAKIRNYFFIYELIYAIASYKYRIEHFE